MGLTRLRRSEVVGYAMGSVGTGAFSTVPGLLLAYYLTDSLGVAAGLAALVVAVPKLWDVLVLPVVGGLSDKAMLRVGSRRPFLLVGGITLPVCFVAMFSVPSGSSPGVAAVWVLVSFTAAATAFAVFQVPYIAMPAEITDDVEERTTLMSWRVVFLSIAILLAGAGAPLIRDGVGGAAGYVAMAVAVALLIAVGMLVCWWALRTTQVWQRAEATTPCASRCASPCTIGPSSCCSAPSCCRRSPPARCWALPSTWPPTDSTTRAQSPCCSWPWWVRRSW